ncbi:hypothetical protein LAZ67_5001373 [Cordylochernes scorpioides]|uniref:H15 domain-containing protein n=1 Tax=Cordylochernes scorpioides TaxID=51811 RepID=A0ABY6KGB7_9ARAC|nr:hypothetical protein LAZ67_5001373 [Cordylochernes scorpioides]
MDQKSGETISKYIIRLKEQAQRCNFGDVLQESLRDRFVAGIIDTPTQKKLLQEEGLTFEGALDIALSAESADNDLHNLKRSEDAHLSPQHLHAINNPCKHCGILRGSADVRRDMESHDNHGALPLQLYVSSTPARHICCQTLGSLDTGSHVLPWGLRIALKKAAARRPPTSLRRCLPTMSDAAAATPAASTPKKKASAAAKAKKAKKSTTHPKVAEMVNEAIANLKERNGSSLQAIKKYIASNFKVEAEKMAPFIRRHLKHAVAQGALVQTKGKGASGSFKFASAAKAEAAPAKPAATKKASAATPKKPKVKKAVKPKAKKAAKTTKKSPTKAKAPKPKKSLKSKKSAKKA